MRYSLSTILLALAIAPAALAWAALNLDFVAALGIWLAAWSIVAWAADRQEARRRSASR